MQPKILFCVSAFCVTGCIPGNNPLRITDTFSSSIDMTGQCAFDTKTSVYGGFLDSTGPNAFNVVLHIVSELTDKAPIVDENGTDLTGPGVNNFIEQGLLLSYTSVNPVIKFGDPEVVAINGWITPGATQDILVNIIGPNGAQKIRESITDTTAAPTTVHVKVVVQGTIESGGKISTTPVDYPLTVHAGASNCANGFPEPSTCGNAEGQNGVAVVCNP